MRVVSLLPATTELVAALGHGRELVARSHECDFPADLVRDLPVVTEPKIDPGGSSRELDDRVRQLVRDGLSVYRINEERLRALEPDLILTQDQCQVCAVSYQEVVEAASRLLGPRTCLLSLRPNLMKDVLSDFMRVAEALADPPSGARLIERVSSRIMAVRELAAGRSRPRVLCIEWMDPLMTAGNWMPEILEWAGASPLLSLPGEHSRVVDWEEVLEADPEVILIAPCGFKLGQTRSDLGALRSRPGWGDLRAVRDGQVFLLDGNAYVNRPGPRLADTLEIVAGLLQPELFPRPPAAAYLPLSDLAES